MSHSVDRAIVWKRLVDLYPRSLLDTLMDNLEMPGDARPPDTHDHVSRCNNVLDWAESSVGPGLS